MEFKLSAQDVNTLNRCKDRLKLLHRDMRDDSDMAGLSLSGVMESMSAIEEIINDLEYILSKE